MKYFVSPIWEARPSNSLEVEAHSFEDAAKKYRKKMSDDELPWRFDNCEIRIICVKRILKFFNISRKFTIKHEYADITKQIGEMARQLDRG